MSTVIRYPNSKNPNSIKDGMEFQDFVTDQLFNIGIIIQNYCSTRYQLDYGENKQAVEIKLDNRCTDTKRLSIEISEKTRVDGDWVKSGIYTQKSLFYVQGNFNIIFLFSTKFLINLHKTGRYQEKEEATICAFYLPFDDAVKYSIHTIYPENSKGSSS